MKEVHKEHIASPVNMPLCHKCASRVTREAGQEKFRCQELVGCSEMTAADWEAGWYAEDGGPVFQHNCPILQQLEK